MQYFEQYQQRVSDIIGPEETQRLVSQALTLITLGGNDFVNNYYLVPFSARSRQFALPDYVVYLISEYRKVLAVRTYILFRFPIIVSLFTHAIAIEQTKKKELDLEQHHSCFGIYRFMHWLLLIVPKAHA